MHDNAPIPAAKQSPRALYRAYIVGFILSLLTTIAAYFFVVSHMWPVQVTIYLVMAIAVLQLVVQMVFFLHIGNGSRWKLVTFIFTLLVVGILVIGTIWVMNHLNYNMMDMNPQEMRQYMSEHEGI